MYFSIYVVGFMDYNGYMWSIKCLTDEKSMQFMLYWENGRQGVTWEMFTTQGSLQWLIFSINDLLTLLRCLYNTAKGRTLDTISLRWEKYPTSFSNAKLYFQGTLHSSPNHSTYCICYVMFIRIHISEGNRSTASQSSWILSGMITAMEICWLWFSSGSSSNATRLPQSLTHEH
jgi:hypothetical protein